MLHCLVKLKPAIVNFLQLCTESTIVGFYFYKLAILQEIGNEEVMQC